ncbi:MAG TPA: aminomethyl-transferring glycine dehydrogenase [Ilumatobacter sp.]|nr:aminomethyl-transferring glycine dehydrogenase [Ilumatobacter sp.]
MTSHTDSPVETPIDSAVDSTLSDLFAHDDFVGRHIGPQDSDLAHMLDVIGVASIAELIDQTVPASIRMDAPLELAPPQSESEVLARLRGLADQNQTMVSLIGQGYYGTHTPGVIKRNVLENPAWYTAYTPYQPEISQGRLEALLNFQTMVSDLTGLDVANASLLDEATAAAEAMTMARRLTKGLANRFFVHHDTHPQTLSVLATRAEPIGIELVIGDVDQLAGDGIFGALFSYPTSTGGIVDWSAAIERTHSLGAQAIVITDLAACVVLASPGSLGADIAVGSAQRFGVPMGFGGPHAGFIAVREAAARSLPGRLVGVSTDTAGRPALRLALQTREQHIRREKATSNICTAQVLLANIAGMYATYHGPDGLRRISERIHALATLLGNHLASSGLQVRHESWFDTIVVDEIDADTVLAAGYARGINLRRVSSTSVGVSCDETTLLSTLDAVAGSFGAAPLNTAATAEIPAEVITSALRRTTPILPQAVFHRHHSEHQMLRYLRRLADRDLALDRTMIPLGSCTMKLNATSEMEPITWPEFADVHPYAPDDQTIGYRTMIAEVESALAVITGYDAVSVQPNAGSQGELAGLLAIRAYHHSRGDLDRVVCLIPASAHGTNAASAVMAGMDVVVVKCDSDGNVDMADLADAIEKVGHRLAAIMVTYPSTHGVFEVGISDLCAMVHDAGGQVYVDGANLNALVGLAQPGKFGSDVSHLNLHKTFCIPHGGGGPGVGPVAVRAHLAPFLPGDPLAPLGSQPVGAVSAARYGSAGILPIPWVYIQLMGGSGLTRATEVAIASANYVAARLAPAYPVLYTGHRGRVAHECIVDIREITRATGVTVDDIAKRLVDYGFHSPTMSFPDAGTLMIEPTESEDLGELDRFIDAMLAIRTEIDEVAAGGVSIESSALRNAPHPAVDVLSKWEQPYSAEAAAFPVDSLRDTKYWPPVSRIDGAYGDRNLVCTCEPLEAYATER